VLCIHPLPPVLAGRVRLCREAATVELHGADLCLRHALGYATHGEGAAVVRARADLDSAVTAWLRAPQGAEALAAIDDVCAAAEVMTRARRATA
jgi:hypothetical protein